MLTFSALVLGTLGISYILLGVIVLVMNPKKSINWNFFLVLLTIVGWMWSNYLSNVQSFPVGVSVALNDATFIFPTFTLYFLLRFIMLLAGTYRHASSWIRIGLAVPAVLIGLIGTTPLLVAGIVSQNGRYIINFGSMAWLYFVYIISYFLLIIFILIKGVKGLKGLEKSRLKYVSLGIFVTLLVSILTNLVIPFLGDNFSLDTLGPISTVAMVVSFTYAIIRQRLFDIRLVVARSVAYLCLLATLAAFYTFGIFGITRYIFPDAQSSFGQNVVYATLAIISSFLFQPLRRFFERITDNLFYKNHYDSQIVLEEISKILVSELELNHILKRSLAQLCKDLHIEFGQLVIFNNDRVYRVEHYGRLPQRLMVAPELVTLKQSMLVADELEGGARKALMENHGIRISLTLHTREEFIGYLLLGDKLSGDVYSSQDIHLLEIIGKQLAVAILNAKAYAQIEEFNLTLQARVDHATNRLRVANRHLKELDHAKDEFISMASHQLRTPLTTIKGYLSMMLEGDSGPLTATQREFVGYAFGSSERMVNLISDLLNVSRLSAGRFLIQTKPTDMVAMIADEVRQLKTHAAAKNIKLIFDPPPEILPPAEIDDNKTRQVVMNFIDNAIYYTQEGEVRVVLEQSGDRVRLEVRDSGIGVPDAAKRKLFTKFFRADNAQTMRPDGTGLGLYLAKRVVEDQGGTIIFNSVEGKGSTFGFELPFKPITPIREVAHVRHDKSV